MDKQNLLPKEHPGVQPKQAVPVFAGETPAFRNQATREKLVDKFDERVDTMYTNFKFGLDRFPNRQCLGERTRSINDNGEIERGQYTFQTYKEVAEHALNFGSGLRHLGAVPKEDNVGIFSINRNAWVIADIGIQSQSLVTVSVYDTLGPNVVEFITNHANLKIICCSADKTETLLKVKPSCEVLSTVIQFDDFANEKEASSLRLQAEEVGVKLYTMSEVEKMGSDDKVDVTPPEPSDICTIMYTSGTTGNPKGVVLTHKNVVAAEASAYFHDPTFRFSETDLHLSYLPLAHIFERVVQAICFAFGGSVGFYQGSVSKIRDDLCDLKPTVFIGVPRIFNRIHDRLMSELNRDSKKMKFAKAMFKKAYKSKVKSLHAGQKPKEIWHKLVFHKAKHSFGGRVRGILCGSAPLDPQIHEFLEVVFCCPVVQGYGLTETCAATCVQRTGDPFETRYGHVGAPTCVNEIKLVDVPELKYHASDYPNPRGEVCVRGPNVFKEYYKEPEKTAEVLDADGWFHTGDIGRFNENGTLSIIDRKKNIFKLAQGEYVAVEYLEGIYQKSDFVDQIWVYGNSYKSTLVAVIIPDEMNLFPWCKKNKIPMKEGTTLVYNKVTGLKTDQVNMALVCNNPTVQSMLLKELQATGQQYKVKGYERIAGIVVDYERWTPDNDCLTPSMKLRRNQLLERFQDRIDVLYEHIEKGETGLIASTLSEEEITRAAEAKIAEALGHPAEGEDEDLDPTGEEKSNEVELPLDVAF